MVSFQPSTSRPSKEKACRIDRAARQMLAHAVAQVERAALGELRHLLHVALQQDQRDRIAVHGRKRPGLALLLAAMDDDLGNPPGRVVRRRAHLHVQRLVEALAELGLAGHMLVGIGQRRARFYL
ncbi:hypothetical protein ACFSKM_14750 [Ancylobacter dichloromethanicus]